MDNYLEHYHRTEGNFHFYLLIIDILKDLTKDVPNLRVLDYGAGAIPYTITPISVLQKDQHTVAYDPQLAEDILKFTITIKQKVTFTRSVKPVSGPAAPVSEKR